MSSPLRITDSNGDRYFQLEQYQSGLEIGPFSCPIAEYNLYLEQDALRSRNDHVALTWLLRDRKDGGTVAYMSLIADAIKLSVTEKELHHLDYPFKTIPAMKIAKLAVSSAYADRYKGVGSFMLTSAHTDLKNDIFCLEIRFCYFIKWSAKMFKRTNNGGGIFFCCCNPKINIHCCARIALYRQSISANQHKFNLFAAQCGQHFFVIVV
ncbi:hypothetical protein FACS189450_06940 [Spirochaetia bacterium]|nr:hypothetical protein FACS189450_06940 [Spirochaetia bacterium]